jgi:hypothetical protein
MWAQSPRTPPASRCASSMAGDSDRGQHRTAGAKKLSLRCPPRGRASRPCHAAAAAAPPA